MHVQGTQMGYVTLCPATHPFLDREDPFSVKKKEENGQGKRKTRTLTASAV